MQNESTPGARGPVFCGVDTHADSHWLCVLDWRGRKVLSRRFPADAAGYEALAGAIAAAGEPACVAMEGTSSYGAGLTRHLASLGMPVREALSPARAQRRRPGQGKCDESDAERAARAAMSGSKLGTPKSQDGWVDGVRCMLAARSGAVKARTSAINTARSLLTTAPEGLRSRFRGMAGPDFRSIGTGRPSRPSAKWILKNTLPNRSVRTQRGPAAQRAQRSLFACPRTFWKITQNRPQ